jgi:hypothetical protein
MRESCSEDFRGFLARGEAGALALLEEETGSGESAPGGAPFEPDPLPCSPGGAATRTNFGNAFTNDCSMGSFAVPRMFASAALTSGMYL